MTLASASSVGRDAALRLLGHDQHAVIAPVAGKRDAEAVEDAAARGREQPLIDAVVFGLVEIVVAVHDLKLIEPPGEHAEDARSCRPTTEARGA